MRPIVLDPWVAVVVDVVAWAVVHASTGYLVHRIDRRRFAADTFLTRPRKFEAGGHVYVRWLRIKRWKKWLPEAGAFFAGGFDKRSLRGTNDASLRRAAEETRRAEWGHALAASCSPLFFLWNPWPVGVVMLGYAVVSNGPCVAAQRYNRVRFVRILEKRAVSRPGPASA